MQSFWGLNFFRMGAAVLLAVPSAIHAQTFTSIPGIAFDAAGPVIRAHTESQKPFTVAGERGVILGQQDGTFEAWVLPVKLLSHLTIEARIEGYSVPIDVNQQAAEIEVRPDRTVITYSHIGFTVRQIMFSPRRMTADAGTKTGPVVLFQFDCLHPTDFTFRFTPELRWMWPERNEGVPGAEWVAHRRQGKRQAATTSCTPTIRTGRRGHHSRRHARHPGALSGAAAGASGRAQAAHRSGARSWTAVSAADGCGNHARRGYDALHWARRLPAQRHGSASVRGARRELQRAAGALHSIETPDKALNEAFQWAVVRSSS
jgi:hypothetical protein